MTYTQNLLSFGVGLLVFWLVVFLLGRIFPLKRYGVEVQLGSITFRSSGFKAFLYNISTKSRVFWMTLSNLSMVFGVGLTVYAAYFLLENLLKLIRPGVGGAALLPVVPGLTIRLYWLPYLLLAVSLGVVTHEAAHGVIARLENISLKSAGLAFVLAFLAGFVEPDEEEFERSPNLSKLRVVSAGSFVNLMAFLIVMLVSSAFFVNVPSGIVMTEVLEGSPVEHVGLQRWDVIYDVNGTLRNLTSLLANTTAGDVLVLNTSKGVLWVAAEDSMDVNAFGILPPYLVYYPSRLGLGAFFDVQLYLIFFWGGIVFSSLAILNMLPLFPFDGDKFLFYLTKMFAARWSREFRIVFNVVFFGVMAGNMIVSLIKHGSLLI